jgi:hypothetical protein
MQCPQLGEKNLTKTNSLAASYWNRLELVSCGTDADAARRRRMIKRYLLMDINIDTL